MATTPDTLTGPADIIAALPGIFGFYPQESTVIVGLYPPQDNGGAVRLGPVMRTDLSRTELLLPMLRETPGGRCCAFYAVIVSRIPNSKLVEEAKEQLYAFSSADGTPLIDACWHVSEVAHGTPYTIVFGPAPAQLAASALGGAWVSGTVSSVVSSPAMRALVDNGALPELERADTFRFFEPWDERAYTHPDCDPEAAAQSGARLEKLLSRRSAAAGEILADGCALLHDVDEAPLVEPLDYTGTGSVFGTDGDGVELAALLTRSVLRDSLVIDALSSPLRSARGLLWVAKAYRGTIRANALTLWAVVAVHMGLSSWAITALTLAQEEVHGHNLSQLLIAMMHNGMEGELIDAAVTGCAASWAAVGAQPA